MKYIFIDWGVIMFKSIFNHETNPKIPPTYTAMAMLFGAIKKVGLNEEDMVVIAVDSPEGSWRKEVDGDYKANRKKDREKHKINWNRMFQMFKLLLEDLDRYTPFHVLVASKLEADDIISCGCRKFKDNDCIIVSSDSDYEQLLKFPNVKWFSNQTKRYKISKNPMKALAKKVEKERADNLLSPILSTKDYERRLKIVTLLTLPKEVEDKAEEKLNFLPEKNWDISSLPFPSLHNRIYTVYEKDKVVKSEQQPRKKRKHNGNISSKRRQTVL